MVSPRRFAGHEQDVKLCGPPGVAARENSVKERSLCAVFEVTDPELSRALRWLNLSHRVWLNRRHGDGGRDLVLYLGRRQYGMKHKELVEAAGVSDDAAMAMALQRLEKRLPRSNAGREHSKRVREMLTTRM